MVSDPPDHSTVREPIPARVRSVPRLVWTDARGQREAVIERRTLVGSASKAELVVADRSVSRLHAEIEPTSDGLRVRDLASTNGVWSGEIRIYDACLRPGARLQLGGVELRLSTVQAEDRAREVPAFGDLLGAAVSMRRLFADLERIAESEASVLIQGETGTGKELCARALHDASPRRDKPFVVIDCAALPESLLESELFGHVRGAFTGAVGPRRGAFEEADGGTVFLDEVGELTLGTQPKLLRVLESRTVRRLGETTQRAIDIRIISATHRDLARMVGCGAFREDLYFRLAVLPVRMPPVRERPEDVPALLDRFLGRSAATFYGAELLEELTRLPWLGNVREVKNFAERSLALGPEAASALTNALGDHPTLTPAPAIGAAVSSPAPAAAVEATDLAPFKEYRERWIDRGEAEYVRALLARHGANVSAAAREAGINRSHLYRLIKKHGG